MTNFEKVKAFHRAFCLPAPSAPMLLAKDRLDLREDLEREERIEYEEAVEARDLVAIADSIADRIYILYGTAVEYGIDIDACIRVIHDANMAKLGPDGKPIINDGVMRPDLPVGKVLKPEGWSPPDLREVLFGPSQSHPVLSPNSDTEAPLPGGWRDIETAPRDGTKVLVYVPGASLYPTAAQYDTRAYFEREYGNPDYMEEGWRWSFGYPADFHEETIQPTHWMPLPEPPSKGTLTKGEGV